MEEGMRPRSKTPVPAEAINLSPAEAATVIGIGRSSVYELMGTGKLRFAKHGRRTLIPRAEAVRVAHELADV